MTQTGEETRSRYTVPGLERGLRLLCEFDRQTKSLTAPELARRMELPRSTLFRLLTTLEEMGFLKRDASSHEYSLDVGVLRLGFEYLASQPINELAHPLLEELSHTSGNACALVIRDGTSVVYVARVAQPSPFASAVSVGTRLPVYATALGRALLFDFDLDGIRSLYPEAEFPRATEQTPGTPQELFELVQRDRVRGCAISEGFYEANISAIAAPVRTAGGQIVAVLGMTMNRGRMDVDAREVNMAHVLDAAGRLSALLGYHGAIRSPDAGAKRETMESVE